MTVTIREAIGRITGRGRRRRIAAVACVGRVGSEYLNSLLDSHPGIDALGEVFRPMGEFETSPDDDPSSFIESVSIPGRITIFKLSLHALDTHPATSGLIGTSELIRLRRENLLAQHISGALALQADSWRQEGYGDARVVLPDPLGGLQRLKGREMRLDRIIGTRPAFEITYERIDEQLDDLQRYLGLDPVPLSSSHRRLRQRPLNEVVANWDDLVEALRGTEFERYTASAVDDPA